MTCFEFDSFGKIVGKCPTCNGIVKEALSNNVKVGVICPSCGGHNKQ